LKDKISSKCDVFSFGVVLFEIFSKGGNPWGGFSNPEVIEALSNEKRMPLPKNFGPQFIVELIKKCWNEEPNERPTFKVKKSINIFIFFSY
jgi:serine/threonine protein kinase